MFTGLIEAIGRLHSIQPFHGGRSLCIDLSGLSRPSTLGASIAVNGICLTISSIKDSLASFDAVSETVSRSTLQYLTSGQFLNLESALRAGDPLDGHLVQGHIDGTGTLISIINLPESKIYRFSMSTAIAPLVAQKGSIAIDGVSLTVVDTGPDWFTVSLIPMTLKWTTLEQLRVGSHVNLEADVLARYLARQLSFHSRPFSSLTEERLHSLGY